MQAFDLDPNLYSFLSGSYRLWPYTRLAGKPEDAQQASDAGKQSSTRRRSRKRPRAAATPACAGGC